MIRRTHTEYYECRMRSNKVECSTVAGTYITTHNIKVTFCIPEFSSSRIISHRFHIDNNEGKSGIGYDMIIGRDMMVQLGLLLEFNRQVFQWDGVTVTMKNPAV